jgi:hypothetical protein
MGLLSLKNLLKRRSRQSPVQWTTWILEATHASHTSYVREPRVVTFHIFFNCPPPPRNAK